MSQTATPLPSPSWGRTTPFWDWLFTSGAAQVALWPASMAGLPVGGPSTQSPKVLRARGEGRVVSGSDARQPSRRLSAEQEVRMSGARERGSRTGHGHRWGLPAAALVGVRWT